MKISVILPCMNEEQTIGKCIDDIHQYLKGQDYEIIVVINGNDDSSEIAVSKGAEVYYSEEGYGKALKIGFSVANGDYIIMVDCDGTYDIKEIPNFINRLEDGYELVIGSRFKGNINSMKWLHRYVGNPLLNLVFNRLYHTHFTDTHSGFRAIDRDTLKRLELKEDGWEIATEMIIKAKRLMINITEIPINYNARIGKSKLRSFRDGFNHLKFLLNTKGGKIKWQ